MAHHIVFRRVPAHALALVTLASALTAGGQETIAPAREGLVDLCDGDDELLEEEELRRYLVVLNEPLFQEYDLDCSGMIEGPEEAMYFAAERAKADRRLAEAQDR